MTVTPHIAEDDVTVYLGDVRDVLAELPDCHVDCIVTSPPYWGLRDYGTGTWEGGDPACDHVNAAAQRSQNLDKWSAIYAAGGGHKASSDNAVVLTYCDRCGKCGATRVDRQLGLEATPDCLGWATGDRCGGCYVCELVAILGEARRVLADHGTLWLNLGDSYASGEVGRVDAGRTSDPACGKNEKWSEQKPRSERRVRQQTGLKRKELVGVPWRVALALQADGWYLRSDIIWAKKNAMPESVTDRPTKAHEYVLLLAKGPRYYFDQDAVREPHKPDGRRVTTRTAGDGSHDNYQEFGHDEGRERWPGAGRNVRTVWNIATRPYPGAHFATFPEDLAQRAVLAGCPRQVCRSCGKPRERVAGLRVLDLDRPQARRALELAEEAALTPEHIDAIRSVGIADTGKALVTTSGAGRNDPEKQRLAQEARDALGGYYREFLLARPSHGGWSDCECAYGLEHGDLDVIRTPTGSPAGDDPSLELGRAGLARPRADDAGTRPITRYEQRMYAVQIKASPHRDAMQAEAGTEAFAHYVRTDRTGARAVPPALLAAWLDRGWLEPVELPQPREGTYRPGVVLDPFLGSGTTAVVARRERRHAVGVELNPDYVPLIRERLDNWHRRTVQTAPAADADQLTLTDA